MKINNKKSYILIFSILIIIGIIICLKIYKRPIDFNKTYNDVLVIENKKKIKDVDIKIKAKLYKRDFIWEILKFEQVLEGKVTIDNKDYYLFATNQGKFTDNITWGDLRTSPEASSSEYVFYLTKDAKKLYIRTVEDESVEMIYPVNSKADYNSIKKIMYND